MLEAGEKSSGSLHHQRTSPVAQSPAKVLLTLGKAGTSCSPQSRRHRAPSPLHTRHHSSLSVEIQMLFPWLSRVLPHCPGHSRQASPAQHRASCRPPAEPPSFSSALPHFPPAPFQKVCTTSGGSWVSFSALSPAPRIAFLSGACSVFVE